ncbi:MAG: rhodanese-like domain-containing protein [Omnitrophica bacterium]|nr:rhodanese-like domain-containing protein [Candidatus Omnitrophota bacterium]
MNKIQFITTDELINLMASNKPFKLVDVLSREHYNFEHIKGAISLPFEQLGEKAIDFLNKKDTIVVYCASFHCQASTNAAKQLMAMGFEHVLDYKGGLKDYKEGRLPVQGSICGSFEGKRNTCIV